MGVSTGASGTPLVGEAAGGLAEDHLDGGSEEQQGPEADE